MTKVASPAFGGHRHELTGRSLHLYRKVTMDNTDDYYNFFVAQGSDTFFWDFNFLMHSK